MYSFNQQTEHQIWQGDCRTLLPRIPDGTVDLTFTSPPYYNARAEYAQYESYQAYLDFMQEVVKEICRVTRPGHYFVLNTSPVIEPRTKRSAESKRYPIPFDLHPLIQLAGFEFVDDIIWQKPEGAVPNRIGGFQRHRKPLAYKPNATTEYLMVYRKPDGSKLIDAVLREYPKEVVEASLVTGKVETSNVWRINPADCAEHPAAFPLELATKIIQLYSMVGDLVLDPFLGSGTTALAAHQLERKCIGIEKKAEYYELSCKRLQAAQQQLKFAELKLQKQRGGTEVDEKIATSSQTHSSYLPVVYVALEEKNNKQIALFNSSSNPSKGQYDNIAIKSPFRWPGGKFYARQQILAALPPSALAGCFIEPFAGGGSIFFAKPKSERSILADADPELINCYLQIRDNPEALIALFAGVQTAKEYHDFIKNSYQPTSNFERAFRFFVLNRLSYSGIMTKGHCYFGFDPEYSMGPSGWIELVRQCSSKLQGVEIVCQDFSQTIEAAPDGAVLFVDPPYYAADQHRLYVHSFNDFDHICLAEILKTHSHRLKFLLTYDDVSEIRALYDWASEINSKSWRYNVNRTDYQLIKGRETLEADAPTETKGRRAMGRELFISNYLQSAKCQSKVIQLPVQTQFSLLEAEGDAAAWQ